MANQPQKSEARCPCCGTPQKKTHDKDEFASVFRIWSAYHRIALDMNGGHGAESTLLIGTWERTFRNWVNPLPTSEELSDATQFMVQDRDLATAPWATHFAILKKRIMSKREVAKRAKEEEERRQYIHDAAQRNKTLKIADSIGKERDEDNRQQVS